MTKTLTKVFAVMLSFLMLIPTSFCAYANEGPEWEDIYLTEEEFNEILEMGNSSNDKTKATGLITSWGLGVSKSGSKLVITGKTICQVSVVKCGFTKVVIQSRRNSSSSWITYATYEDLYSNSSAHSIAKSIEVNPGNQYRATAVHYAKKSIFSTEKINNTSNIVTF